MPISIPALRKHTDHGGTRSGAGRPKGSLGKENRDIKEMILGALSDVGGRKYLAECARKQPAAFLTLVGKVLPLQIAATNDDGTPITGLSFSWAPASPLIEAQVQPVDVGQFTPAKQQT